MLKSFFKKQVKIKDLKNNASPNNKICSNISYFMPVRKQLCQSKQADLLFSASLYRCIKHRQNCILKTAMDTSNVSDKLADVSSSNEVSYVHNGSFKYIMNSSSYMNILIPMHIICLQTYLVQTTNRHIVEKLM